jgi:hypothetical protein
MTKELLFNLSDYSNATFYQNFVASIGGAVASITVAAPLDVVKTRVQQANFESSVGGMAVIREMVKKEGMGAFFKGLTPKVRPPGPDALQVQGLVGLTFPASLDPRRRPQARLLLHARPDAYPLLRKVRCVDHVSLPSARGRPPY